MRRILTTAIASSALALALPGVAAAAPVAAHHDSHDSPHHRAHHANGHRRPVQHTHTILFGAPVAPIPAVGAPATPSPAATPSAATIASFTNGTLTIELADGTLVSGRVSEETAIRCQPAGAPSTNGEGQDNGDLDSHGGPRAGDGGNSSSDGPMGARQEDSPGGSGPGDDQAGDDNGEDRADENANGMRCTAAALAAGVLVREAELRVSSVGAVWEQLELLQ